MIRYHELVYDGIIIPGVTTYTGVQHTNALALGDRMGLQAIIDRGVGGTFTAAIEHSGDGINWTQKNTTPEINAAVILVGQYTSVYGGEAYPPVQSLEHLRIRLEVAWGGTGNLVIVAPTRVRLHAVLRERGKGRYSTCGCSGEEPCGGGAPERSPRDEHVRKLRASRPHASMAELERHLLRVPLELEPKERLRRALGMLGERERLEVMGFLQRAALADEASREAAQD